MTNPERAPRFRPSLAVPLLIGGLIVLAGIGIGIGLAGRQTAVGPTPTGTIVSGSQTAAPQATMTAGPSVTPAEPSASAQSTPPAASEPPAATKFEYVRFLVGDVPISSRAGGGDFVEWTYPAQVATVIDRTTVDGIEWSRVEVGSSRTDYRTRYGWVPLVAAASGGDSQRVYEPATVACPTQAPTITSLASLLPTQALECFAGRTLTFSPVRLQFTYTPQGETIPAEPVWLTFESFWAFDSHLGDPFVSMGVYLDAPLASIPTEQWVAIRGGFDDPAAGTCRVHGDLSHWIVADKVDPVRWCRTKFVVSDVRLLSEGESPQSPAPPTVGEPASRIIAVANEPIRGPLKPRFFPSAVWTGAEMIVWGGSRRGREGLLSDGAAYDPKAGRWRVIGPGPLTEREGHLAVWTGEEMLIWGGQAMAYIEPPDGAGYDPQTDLWRPIATGPLRWEFGATSVWTGSEWVIASTGADNRTRFAAYDPRADRWRTLPPVDVIDGGGKSLVWTGDDLVFADGSGFLKRLPRGAGAWIPIAPSPAGRAKAPLLWTGEHVLTIAWRHINHSLRQSLAAWDPSTDKWLAVPRAPKDLGEVLVWADGRAIVVESDLAYDAATRSWWELPMPNIGADYGNVVLWAGDRLFIWGGGMTHGTVPNQEGSVSIPTW